MSELSQNSQNKSSDNEKKIEIEYHSHGLYYVIPSQIMDSDLLLPIEKLCYALLSGLANEKGECFPSNSYLAKRLGCSEKWIEKIIPKLTKLGLITKHTERIYGKRPKRTIKLINNFKNINNNMASQEGNDTLLQSGNGTLVQSDDSQCDTYILESEDILESEVVGEIATTTSNSKDKKEILKKYPTISLTKKQMERLKKKYSSKDLDFIFSKLHEYKKKSGKKYTSDYNAILRWVSVELESNKSMSIATQKRIKENKEWVSQFFERLCNANVRGDLRIYENEVQDLVLNKQCNYENMRFKDVVTSWYCY